MPPYDEALLRTWIDEAWNQFHTKPPDDLERVHDRCAANGADLGRQARDAGPDTEAGGTLLRDALRCVVRTETAAYLRTLPPGSDPSAPPPGWPERIRRRVDDAAARLASNVA